MKMFDEFNHLHDQRRSDSLQYFSFYDFNEDLIHGEIEAEITDNGQFGALTVEYEGETIMMARASGVYSDEGYGKNEVRIAYAIDKSDLKRAIFLLGKALEQYPGRIEI